MSEVAALVGQEFGPTNKIVIQESVALPESYVPENTETKKRLGINRVLDFRESVKFWSTNLGVNHSSRFH
jgi:hypothetical protein